MRNGKLLMGGTLALSMVAFAPAAFAADPIVITPGQASDKTVTYQEAAPTRHFNVEKATTLAPGESRFGASLNVGGLGVGGATPGLAGGVNLRADTNIQPGLEAGIAVSGMGAGGASNLLGNVVLDGKLHWTEFSVGATPVEVGALATLGALASGGGLASGSIGVGIPMTAALSNRLNVTVSPGVSFGIAGGGLLPGGATPTASAAGLIPALGLGLDWMVTDRLSALVDGNVGFSGGMAAAGNVGLRYGISDAFAADLFLGYAGNPANAVNAGTVGLGGYYAF
ncbi:MAG: hypothetical protein ACK46X_12455 [Candidatus Sericytochromatia bacterium]